MARKGQKKKKKVRRETNKKNPEKRQRRKRKKVLTKETDPWGDSFIPSMKSKNRIFLDGALVGAGSLKPLLPSNFKCNLC